MERLYVFLTVKPHEALFNKDGKQIHTKKNVKVPQYRDFSQCIKNPTHTQHTLHDSF